ncbi:MAG: sodium:alanine symporter family protein [Ruminococcaceae bacterium]|nr:sodium:alanine symporter family protein [Oscillospiraceae bacterium]
MTAVTEFVSGAFLPLVLFFTGIYFFIFLSRHIFSPLKVCRALKKGRDRSLSFSSLWLALGGTLGVGNITGVCAAISVGGAGTVFWIWVCALFSSVIKYAETVLAVHFRETDGNGRRFGGAYSYIKNALKSPRTAVFFAILCVITSFTMGNITQVKSASDAAYYAFGIPTPIFSFLFFVIVLIICSGGGKLITAFTGFTVPFLCVFYVVLSLIVIVALRENIPEVTARIFREAFTPRAGVSGIAAYLCSPAMRLGITRGVMSNEAGCGTAPIAYAAGKSTDACGTGLLGIAEVLCDTLLLCTLTAYAVLLSGTSMQDSSVLTAYSAFSSVLGKFVYPLLGASISLFALAAVTAWGFYGRSAMTFLGMKQPAIAAYCFLFSLSSFLSAFIPESLCWKLADLSISLMAVINVIALFLLFPTVKRLTKEYFI